MATIHVLLLEGDPFIRDLLLDTFADEGWETTVCHDVADIRASLERYPSAVVVAEAWRVERGRTLSPEHAAEIRSLAQVAPLVLLSSWPWAQDASSYELGAVILMKPFNLGQLIDTIRFLARRAQGQ